MKGRNWWHSSFAALSALWFGRSLRERERDEGTLRQSSMAQPAGESINALNAKGNGLARRLVSSPSPVTGVGLIFLLSLVIFVLFPVTIPSPSDHHKEERDKGIAVAPAPSSAAVSQDKQGNDAIVSPAGSTPSGSRLSQEDERRKYSVFPGSIPVELRPPEEEEWAKHLAFSNPDSLLSELRPPQEDEWAKNLAFSNLDSLLSELRPTQEDEWRRYAVFPNPGSTPSEPATKESISQPDEGDRASFGSVPHSGKLEDTKKAAAEGIADAQYALAVYFASPGAAQDFKQAVLWCERAAVQGHAIAQIAVGEMYERGLPGVPKDFRQAAFWYEKALAQQVTERTALLALYSLRSEGEAMDYVEARKWAIIAAARDIDPRTIASIAAMRGKSPRPTRASVEEKMTPEQIAEAERRANAWLTAPK